MGIQLTPERIRDLRAELQRGLRNRGEQRWGDTDAWAQSQQRTSKLTREQWIEIKETGDDLNRRLAAGMQGGAAPTSTEAMDLAEEHRLSIQTFYDCPPEMHRGLGEMYVADERFTRTYEDVAPGWRRGCVTPSTPTPTGRRPRGPDDNDG